MILVLVVLGLLAAFFFVVNLLTSTPRARHVPARTRIAEARELVGAARR